ncbi:LacI family DNA-binding transcriptional regulator [Caldicellulosiruptoraceae bacterium PP1]
MASIEDVAREAKVSIATVSRVLNNPEIVSEKTKKLVLDAIDKLNYTPNMLARNLASRKTNTIAVISQEIAGPFFGELSLRINEAAIKSGYGVLFCNSSKEFDYVRFLIGKVDGVLIVGYAHVDNKHLKMLISQNIPTILIQSSKKLKSIPTINIDNFNGAYKATSYLIQKGCKKIIHIHGPKNHFEAIERFEGFKKALEDNSIPFNKNMVIYGNFMMQPAYENCLKTLKKYDVDGIFASSDLMAYAAILAAKDLGINVPDKLKVIGFDDIEYYSLNIANVPSLTTIRQPLDIIAITAVNLMKDMLDGKKVLNQHIVLPADLIVRKSAD